MSIHNYNSDLTLTEDQAKEDAAALQKDKIKLEEKQKTLESYSLEKEDILNKKVNTVGNYVHESVPVSDNEVSASSRLRGVLLSGTG